MPCRSQVPECPSARSEMLDLRVGVPECPSARPLFFSWKEGDTQVPECPSARLEMLDLKVGVPEGPSARPLFFFLEGMEMVGLRGGVPEGPSALPFFSGRKIGSVPKYPSARPFPSPEGRYKITAHIRKIYQQKNQVPKCPGRPSARSLHPTPIISHI